MTSNDDLEWAWMTSKTKFECINYISVDNFRNKPSHSYADLIRMAITSTESKRMTRSEIHDFVGMCPFTTYNAIYCNTSSPTSLTYPRQISEPTTQTTTQHFSYFTTLRIA